MTEAFTYDQLFDILRAEKNSNNLQQLPPQYESSVQAYLKDKQEQLTKSLTSSNVFAQDDIETLQTQLRNARRIVRMIYDIREKKVMQLALNKSRTSSTLIDTSQLLEREIELFKEMLHVLEEYRLKHLQPLLQQPVQQAPQQPQQQSTPSASSQESTFTLLRVLEDIPELVGPDLKKYGPFHAEDIANIPKDIASALLSSNKAQELKPGL